MAKEKYTSNLTNLVAISPEETVISKLRAIKAFNALHPDDPILITATGLDSPLKAAVARGNTQILDYLFGEFGLDIDAQDSCNEKAAVHYAAKYNCEVLNYLKNRGANLNLKDSRGRTPYHVALQFKKEGAADWLYVNGADLETLDNKGKSLALYAIEANIVRHLKFLHKTTNKALEPYKTGRLYFSPLHHAVLCRNLTCASYINKLYYSGLNHQLPSSGATPLMISLSLGYVEISRLFIEDFNLNPRIKDCRQQTILHHAAYSDENHEIIASLGKLFECFRISVNTKSAYNITTLDTAIQLSNHRVAAALESIGCKATASSKPFSVTTTRAPTLVKIKVHPRVLEIRKLEKRQPTKGSNDLPTYMQSML